MADYIPEEIIIKILQKLPIKTLVQTTCVCKSWYTLITSSHFISSHSKEQKHSPPLLLLRRCIRNVEHYALHWDSNVDSSLSSVADTIDFPFKSMNSYFTIIGSCNGLLCISDDRVYHTHTVILWNPCINKLAFLPRPCLVYNSYGTFVQSLGFGYDSVADDYKVVRITYVDYAQIELYRLSTGVWQDLTFLGLQHVVYNRSRQAYVRNAPHWVAKCLDGYDLVLLFDMCQEVFREIRLPASLSDHIRSKDLMVHKDSLGVMVSNMDGIEPGFSIWLMKEYGRAESWSEYLRIGLQTVGSDLIRPLWIRECGGVLIVCQDGRMICYDPQTSEVRELGASPGLQCEDYQRSVHIESYAETLVLLDKGIDVSMYNRLLPNLRSKSFNMGFAKVLAPTAECPGV